MIVRQSSCLLRLRLSLAAAAPVLPALCDDDGHGTHVAGIVPGSGDNSFGARPGIAPEVHLVSLKVLDARGAGHIIAVIGAFDWVVDQHAACNIRVIDLSAGASVAEYCLTDPLAPAARHVVDAGLHPDRGTPIDTTARTATTGESV